MLRGKSVLFTTVAILVPKQAYSSDLGGGIVVRTGWARGFRGGR
jgi:hypothetical protein